MNAVCSYYSSVVSKVLLPPTDITEIFLPLFLYSHTSIDLDYVSPLRLSFQPRVLTLDCFHTKPILPSY